MGRELGASPTEIIADGDLRSALISYDYRSISCFDAVIFMTAADCLARRRRNPNKPVLRA